MLTRLCTHKRERVSVFDLILGFQKWVSYRHTQIERENRCTCSNLQMIFSSFAKDSSRMAHTWSLKNRSSRGDTWNFGQENWMAHNAPPNWESKANGNKSNNHTEAHAHSNPINLPPRIIIIIIIIIRKKTLYISPNIDMPHYHLVYIYHHCNDFNFPPFT